MGETFSRFDAADYLKGDEDAAAYLEAAAEDGDPAVMTAALGAVARAQNMAKLARDAGMTREGLYKALRPGANPEFGTVAKIARVLGYELALKPIRPTASRSTDARLPHAEEKVGASMQMAQAGSKEPKPPAPKVARRSSGR